MKELEKILREQAKRYPKMQPTDAVKLIYQNEFGGEHLIKDKKSALNYLRDEYASAEKNTSVPLYEDIGNGIIRVNLAAVSEGALEQLGKDFIRSASAHRGSLETFKHKLQVLRALTKQGIFAFDAEVLDAYLAGYEAAGYPAVSHSPQYRDAYRPAYRVVRSEIVAR